MDRIRVYMTNDMPDISIMCDGTSLIYRFQRMNPLRFCKPSFPTSIFSNPILVVVIVVV